MDQPYSSTGQLQPPARAASQGKDWARILVTVPRCGCCGARKDMGMNEGGG
jgi:hypothetical protein